MCKFVLSVNNKIYKKIEKSCSVLGTFCIFYIQKKRKYESKFEVIEQYLSTPKNGIGNCSRIKDENSINTSFSKHKIIKIK